MINQTFNKKATSRLSCDRLMVIEDLGHQVRVKAWNFLESKWMDASRLMSKVWFLQNYAA